MSANHKLPAGYEVLEPFVGRWALATTAERAARRGDSTPAEREAFFAVGAPLLPQAMAYLDSKPLAGLDVADKRLLAMMMSLAHLQIAVEALRETEPRHAVLREAMVITRSVTDLEFADRA